MTIFRNREEEKKLHNRLRSERNKKKSLKKERIFRSFKQNHTMAMKGTTIREIWVLNTQVLSELFLQLQCESKSI